ncbi:UNVERIFIED_CONTAM: hypothetical protein GTU68_043378 [Idotea baltica]|nr:hypothetical protein [Idotea baltica]
MKTDKPEVLTLKELHKSFVSGESQIEVLRNVNLELFSGDICSLVGPSGSGKTSLLGIAVGLEEVTKGSVTLCGQSLAELSEDGRARLRNQSIGFVFQSFQLISSLTAIDNVLVPAELLGLSDARVRATELLERVGLAARMNHFPAQLSGGEQQRVAIARAFINEPKLLLADEPTGNLDEETAALVEELLFGLNREHGTTLVIATHNMRLAERTKRILYLEHGKLKEKPEVKH